MQAALLAPKICSRTLIPYFSGREVGKKAPVCVQQKGYCPIYPSFHKYVLSVQYMPPISLLTGATAWTKQSPHPSKADIPNANINGLWMTVIPHHLFSPQKKENKISLRTCHKMRNYTLVIAKCEGNGSWSFFPRCYSNTWANTLIHYCDTDKAGWGSVQFPARWLYLNCFCSFSRQHSRMEESILLL